MFTQYCFLSFVLTCDLFLQNVVTIHYCNHPPMKKVAKQGVKKEMITVEVKKEIMERHERGVHVAQLSKFYNKCSSTLCTILKMQEDMKALDSAKGVTKVMQQWPRVLEDVEKLLLLWMKGKQLVGDTVTETIICQKVKALFDDLVSKMLGSWSDKDSFKVMDGWRTLKKTPD